MMKQALQIAAGIIIASVVIFGGRLLIVAAAARALAQEVTAMQAGMVESAHERSRQVHAHAAARRESERLLAERAALDRIEQAQLQIERERREADAARQKAAAWRAIYRQAPECEKPPTWELQVECGNRHIRAKRKFEAEWARQEASRRAQPMTVRGASTLELVR